MRLYLLRHGIASDAFNGPDAGRPLSKEGRAKLQQSLPAITQLIDGVELILSSPLVRAYETAELVAAALKPEQEVHLLPGLLPQTKIATLLASLTKIQAQAGMLLVGHEPQLNSLVAVLIGAQEMSLNFKKGALCCIECKHELKPGTGVLQWFSTSRQLRGLSLPEKM